MVYGAEWKVLQALDKVIEKNETRDWASFPEIHRTYAYYSDSYTYSLLRNLAALGLVLIVEDYVGYGYWEAPRRSWEYRLTKKGKEVIASRKTDGS